MIGTKGVDLKDSPDARDSTDEGNQQLQKVLIVPIMRVLSP